MTRQREVPMALNTYTPTRFLTSMDPRWPSVIVLRIQVGKARTSARVIEWTTRLDMADWWVLGGDLIDYVISLACGGVVPVEFPHRLDKWLGEHLGHMERPLDGPRIRE